MIWIIESNDDADGFSFGSQNQRGKKNQREKNRTEHEDDAKVKRVVNLSKHFLPEFVLTTDDAMMKTSKSILQSQYTFFSPTQERDQRKYRLLTKIVGTLTQNFL